VIKLKRLKKIAFPSDQTGNIISFDEVKEFIKNNQNGFSLDDFKKGPPPHPKEDYAMQGMKGHYFDQNGIEHFCVVEFFQFNSKQLGNGYKTVIFAKEVEDNIFTKAKDNRFSGGRIFDGQNKNFNTSDVVINGFLIEKI